MLKKLKLAVCTALAIPLMAAMSSCSSEEDVTYPDVETASASADNIKSALKNSYSGLLDADLSFDAPSRSSQALLTTMPKAANVYVKMPAYSDHADVTMVKNVRSMNDLWKVTKEMGAQLSFVETANADMVITLSDTEVKEVLQPLLAECKNYLFEKGFSANDIQEAVRTANVSEADLIPMVMAFTEIEDKVNQYMLENGIDRIAFANDPNNVDALMNWDGFNGCVLEAFGITVFEHFVEMIIDKTLTKSVLMDALLVTAKKYAGWVAAAFIAYDVAKCVYENW